MNLQIEMKEALNTMFADFTRIYCVLDSRSYEDEIEATFGKILNGNTPSVCLLIKKNEKAGIFMLEADNFKRAMRNEVPLKIVHRRSVLEDVGLGNFETMETLLAEEMPLINKQEGCMTSDMVNDFALWLHGAEPN